jgi:hypothetical protein
MRATVLFSMLVLTTPILAGPASAPSARCVPDEIIVKFRKPLAEILERSPAPKNASERPTLSADLDRLNAKYKAHHPRPLLKDFRRRHRTLDSLQNRRNTRLTQQEQRLLRRLKRAPADLQPPDLGRIYRIRLDPGAAQSLPEIVEAYRSSPEVEYAEFNYIVTVDKTPDDRLYSSQWALDKISAPRAWEVSTGSAESVVAVLDTGVDYNHRDITDNMWINEAELNGAGGIDDDDNGYIDDIYGYNFVYNNGDPLDDHGHGTHCSGIIAARGNNGLDIAGVCWNARIMALKFMGSLGEGTTADAVPAIYYAVENGADVISNSWGTEGDSKPLAEAFDYARSRGVIIVASAGNNNSDMYQYPAAYEHVISVAATDSEDQKWFLSNYGDWVDMAAPGVDILSLRAKGTSGATPYDDHTALSSGTSMAAPHVAGACAMLLSANPLLQYSQVYDMLAEAVDPIEPGVCRSGGRLNVFKLMRSVVPARGYVSFDREYYTCAGNLGLLLADWDLRDQGTWDLAVMTGAGDSETLTLVEKQTASGVFTATIPIAAAEPNLDDQILQIAPDQVIAAVYFDSNDGSGNPDVTIDRAGVDCVLPAVLDVNVQTFGPVATINFETHEPASASIRVGLACGGPYDLVETDPRLAAKHTVKIQPLRLKTRYYFVMDLCDAAGNRATADNKGLCYSFNTPDEFLGFHVPDLYPTIQDAIDQASDGDTVWVADGRYTGEGNVDIDFKGKATTLRSENGPKNCIIDCRHIGRGFLFHSGEDANSILQGFTITNGFSPSFGGGIRCLASSPTIADCIIEDCAAEDSGGGIHNCYASSPVIVNCTFKSNSAIAEASCVAGRGGAVCNAINSSPKIAACTFQDNWANFSGGAVYNSRDCNPTLTDCRFLNNSVGDRESDHGFGGAVSNDQSSPVILRCTFRNNSAGRDGGASYNSYRSSPVFTACLFSRNSALYGGAIKNYNADAAFKNCTFACNTAGSGGAIWNGPDSFVELADCIVWQNTDDRGAGESSQIDDTHTTKTTVVNYCCFQGWTGAMGGLGNFGLEPVFADPNNDDFHLASEGWRWDAARRRWDYDTKTSPCIDAGNPGCPLTDEPLFVPDDPNNQWGLNLRINMGAYGRTAEASMAPPGATLLADLNNDGNVNLRDLALQIRDWMKAEARQPGDLNRDALVDALDLSLLAAEWLKFLRPPFVAVTAPPDGAVIEIWPVDIEISADACDLDGPVVKVEFFVNAREVGHDTDGSDGWKTLWHHDTGGSFTITAKATDAAGAPATSAPIHITVKPPR